MTRAILLLTWVVLSLCACGPGEVQPDGSEVGGTLSPCQSVGNGQTAPPTEADPTAEQEPESQPSAEGPFDPAQRGVRYCMQVAGPGGANDVLQVVALAERDSNPLAGHSVIVYHPGGPGLSPTQMMVEDPPNIDLSRFVLVAWDGSTAAASPGSCGPDTSEFGTSRPYVADRRSSVVEECTGMAVPLTPAGAMRAADELERVRVALGVNSVSLLAHSYGTAIAEAYLRTSGDHVTRAVLDGPMALEASWEQRTAAVARTIDSGVADMLASCTSPTCGASVLAVLAEGTGLTGLRSAVLAGAPTVGSSQLALTPVIFDQATLFALRSQTLWPGFLDAIEESLHGDASALWAIGERQFFDIERAVYYRSLCADLDVPRVPAEYVDDEWSPTVLAFTTDLSPCTGYPVGERLPQAPIAGSPGVLVLASTGDPLTPASLLDYSPSITSVASVCVTDVPGHTSFADPDVAALVTDFLADGSTSASGACVELRTP